MEEQCKKSCKICRNGGGSGGKTGQFGRPSTGDRGPGFLDRLSDAVNSLGGSTTVGALVGPING